jgi:protocatechuate 3,4-dioxygenase alpha subunit
VRHVPTASQTVGPFFNFGLTANEKLGIVAGPDVPGERIRLTFRVIDGEGTPTPGDSMIEIWQADAFGRYAHPLDGAGSAFHGFGRLETDQDGCCRFETIRPGRVAAPDGRVQAPHISVVVFARGLLRHLHTRVYFDGDPLNDGDSVLNLVPEQRRSTLFARRSDSEPAAWHFDVVLQGDSETVFFAV